MWEGQSSTPSGHHSQPCSHSRPKAHCSPLHGLWRFHHKGVTVVNSLAVGPGPPCSPSPAWKSQQWWRVLSPALNPCLVFLGSSPTLPPSRALDTRRRISAQELLLAPWRLMSGGPGHRQTPCSPGSTLGLTLFFVLVLTNHDAECPHRRGCGRRMAVPAGLWAWGLLRPTQCHLGQHCSGKQSANSEVET